MNTKDKTSRRSGLMQLQRTSSKHWHTGFEDLKNFIKEGSDFAKQIVEIIQERAELEATYSNWGDGEPNDDGDGECYGDGDNAY